MNNPNNLRSDLTLNTFTIYYEQAIDILPVQRCTMYNNVQFIYIVQYVQEVVTRPKILNRAVLSN